MIGLQSTPRQLEEARASRLWLDKTLLDFLDEVTPSRLDKVALTDSNSEPGQTAQRR
jgi:cyclohexanecarboxylate-CoA ligase